MTESTPTPDEAVALLVERLTAERDALAAILAEAHSVADRHEWSWESYGIEVKEVLSKLPADALAVRDAGVRVAELRRFASQLRDQGWITGPALDATEEADRIEREARNA